MGVMSLVRRGNSKFWYVQFQINHRTIVRSTRTTDRRAALAVAVRIRAEVHDEIVLGRKKPLTLEEALVRFLNSKAGSPNDRNLASHKSVILRLISGSTLTSSLSQSDLDQFVRRRVDEGSAPQTIKHGLSCLLAALRKARTDGFDSPSLQLPKLKISNKMVRYLSLPEERMLINALDPMRLTQGLPPHDRRSIERQGWLQDNQDLVIMLLDTGARYGEIANIAWKQIDLRNRSINLWRPKVQNESVIFMTDRVVEILTRRLQSRQTEYVFSNKKGGPRGYSAIAIRKALRRTGLADCTIHTLRHTHATRLIQNGLNVYEVKAVLGHSDVRTTMRYAHLEQAVVTQKARDVINRLNRREPGED